MTLSNFVQQHTIKIYNLTEKKYQIKKVKARTLLKPERFDLFAKLFFIKYLSKDPEKAHLVYESHIKAFNPDGKEPGRDDKNSIDIFVKTFIDLITEFEETAFDSSKSLIPVDSNGIILDGAHRVAALAFYDKDVTIIQFENVKALARFDYAYFMSRGLQWNICNLIAIEMTHWIPSLKAACIWPKVKDKKFAIAQISNVADISFSRSINLSFSEMVDFVGQIYQHQSWTKSFEAVKDKARQCYSQNSALQIVLFDCANLDEAVDLKAHIRDHYNIGNHCIHISDNQAETTQIAELLLGKQKSKREFINEFFFCFRNIYWINFKVFIAKRISKVKSSLKRLL